MKTALHRSVIATCILLGFDSALSAQRADTLVACSAEIAFNQTEYRLFPDPRLHEQVYVFVGDIKDRHKRIPTNVALFVTSGKPWGTQGRKSEKDFNQQVGKLSSSSEQWRLKAMNSGDAIQFTFDGRPYILRVARLQTGPLRDRAYVQICQRP